MDGGDEDEHDEGAHQVGLEHLVPHLGVLHREREKKKKKRKKEEEEVRGRRRNKFSDKQRRLNTLKCTSNTPTHCHRCMQWFNHKR